jgi:hypothetical protein
MTKLIYIGKGEKLPNIPARDLVDDDFPAISKSYGWHVNNIPLMLTGNKNSLYSWTDPVNDTINREFVEITYTRWQKIRGWLREKILRFGS